MKNLILLCFLTVCAVFYSPPELDAQTVDISVTSIVDQAIMNDLFSTDQVIVIANPGYDQSQLTYDSYGMPAYSSDVPIPITRSCNYGIYSESYYSEPPIEGVDSQKFIFEARSRQNTQNATRNVWYPQRE